LCKQSAQQWRKPSRGLKETEAKYGMEQLSVEEVLGGCAEMLRDETGVRGALADY